MTIIKSLKCKTVVSAIGVLLVALLTSAGNPSWAEKNYYRWVDSKGVVHYTDKPPKEVAAESIQMGRKPQPQLLEEQNAEEEPSQEETDQKSKSQERCLVERKRLAILKNNPKVNMRSNDGTVKELSAQEIKEEIAFSEKAVQLYCNP